MLGGSPVPMSLGTPNALLEYGPTEILRAVGPRLPRAARLCRPRRLPRSTHPRKPPVSGPREANPPERLTVCWREQDSNHRSPVRRAAVLSLPPSPAESVVVLAEVMVPAEIAA